MPAHRLENKGFYNLFKSHGSQARRGEEIGDESVTRPLQLAAAKAHSELWGGLSKR